MAPVNAQGGPGWMMPSGVIALFVALSSFVWLVGDIALSRSLLCDIEDQHIRAMAIVAGGGCACLAASFPHRNRTRIIVAAIAGVVGSLSAAVLVAALYGVQCTQLQMYLRHLFPS